MWYPLPSKGNHVDSLEQFTMIIFIIMLIYYDVLNMNLFLSKYYPWNIPSLLSSKVEIDIICFLSNYNVSISILCLMRKKILIIVAQQAHVYIAKICFLNGSLFSMFLSFMREHLYSLRTKGAIMIFETDKIISALFPFCLLNTVNNPKLISSFWFFFL